MPAAAQLLGDFQTPEELALRVWQRVRADGVAAVVEPTVGVGNFLFTAPTSLLSRQWYAFDIRSSYVRAARQAASQRGLTAASISERDVFNIDASDFPYLEPGSVVLVVGNPPWVTNSAHGGVGSSNVPTKRNRSKLQGLAALTGSSNFDIAEAVIITILDALQAAAEVRVAMLLKRSVALKIAQDMMRRGGAADLAFSAIDARRWFGASVEAGLFEMTWYPTATSGTHEIELRQSLDSQSFSRAGLVDGQFVQRLDAYDSVRHIEAAGSPPLMWRQGIKHDAARILEFKRTTSGLVNGFGERVDIEPDVLSPLFKSSDLANGRPASRVFPFYQYDLSGPEPKLANRWPRLARYLNAHRVALDARKSRIYKGKPPFMLFGVGPYTAAKFKVAVSGLYKEPVFRVLESGSNGSAPLVDDTCYLLPFEALDEALDMADYLNGRDVRAFLRTITDPAAKRPYTVEILRRICYPRSKSWQAREHRDLLGPTGI